MAGPGGRHVAGAAARSVGCIGYARARPTAKKPTRKGDANGYETAPPDHRGLRSRPESSMGLFLPDPRAGPMRAAPTSRQLWGVHSRPSRNSMLRALRRVRKRSGQRSMWLRWIVLTQAGPTEHLE
jgi:hypothetical protein